MILISLIEGAVAFIFLKRRKWNLLFFSLVISVAFSSAPIAWLMDALNKNYTTKIFAQKLAPMLQKGDKVFVFEQPGAFYDFAFYLPHPVKVVGLSGELEYDRGDVDESDAWVNYHTFDELLAGNERVFCLLRRSDYQEYILANPIFKANTVLIAENEKKVLVGTTAVRVGASLERERAHVMITP
jgi:hypothetical protein